MSPNAIKSLDDYNKRMLCDYIKEWMENDDVTCFDWNRSRLVPFPNKGDFDDPNNWIGINLLDA